MTDAKSTEDVGEKIYSLQAGDECWHYTGAAGLLGIITHHEVWASSAVLGMNDSSEITYGRDVFVSAWQAVRSGYTRAQQTIGDVTTGGSLLEEVATNTFVVSASRAGDSLNQWMHYASGAGYALRFDPDVRLLPISGTIETGSGSFAGWREVIYDVSRQQTLADELLSGLVLKQSRFAVEMNQQVVASASMQLKHPAFADEREARITVVLGRSETSDFREFNGKLIPFVRLGIRSTEAEVRGLLPLLEIRCGPGVDHRSRLVLRRMLDASGYSGVMISTSAIPLL